jgi:2'-5' RNA ligase superfamily
MPCRTALIVPVPEADAYYRPGNGVPAHVTILFPFLEHEAIDEGLLATFFAPFPAFDFVLDRFERFEDGTPWLHPSPPTRFVDLAAAVWQRWPEFAPYEGAFDEIIPHVTVSVDAVTLPITCHAGGVALIEESEEDGRWSTRRTFAFQGVA